MSYITRGARFGGHQSFGVREPMTDDQLVRLAPSVFAAEAHDSRSARFTYIPTFEIVAGLRREGFEVVAAIQGRSRVAGKSEFTKHMLRFRHPDFAARAGMGGVSPEAVLINSHDRTSSYRLMSGVFRSICTNSMIVMEDGATDLRIPHKGDVLRDVIDGTFSVVGESARTVERIEAWNGVTLDHDEQLIMAEAAHVLRFGDAEGETQTPFKAEQLLTPRRRADVGNNLWITHNVLQENIVRGGLHAVGRDANGRRKNATMREVKNIDGDVKLNRALWMLSDRMAQLKKAA